LVGWFIFIFYRYVVLLFGWLGYGRMDAFVGWDVMRMHVGVLTNLCGVNCYYGLVLGVGESLKQDAGR
ncbi:hypothetical protein ACVGXP_11610, partial [Enterobacter hormaechei]